MLTCKIVEPFKFTPLPLGQIKPEGWLLDQMQIMSNGLAGHEADFVSYVNENPWVGGDSDYSDLHEALPYWFNALVGHAYSLDDDRLKSQVLNVSNIVLKNQSSNGWIGPETTYDSNNIWGRFPMMLGLMQLAEAEPSMTQRIVSAIHRFVPILNTLLHDGKSPDETWGRARYGDMSLVLQWLVTYHPSNDTALIFDTMAALQEWAIDWPGFYSEGSFPFGDLDQLPSDLTDALFPYLHGVNVAQGLKASGVDYRYNKNESLVQTSMNAVNWTITYHGAPSGTILGDERIASLNPNRGSEFCTTVEAMYSISYLHRLFGNPTHADLVERIAFNAMPVMLTPDHWDHQYIALPNQPWADVNNENTGLWWNVGPDGIIFGVLPNYPCCGVNHPQGYPKFLQATFALSGQNGLAQTLLAPASVNTTLASGNEVSVTCDTTYPFGQTLTYSIQASKPFTFSVRVPTWTDPSFNPTSNLTISGVSTNAAPSFDSSTNMLSIDIPAGSSQLLYGLAPQLYTEPRANESIAIYHGSILYALDIGETSSMVAPDVAGAPVPLADVVYYNNTTPWNIAVDPSTIEWHPGFSNSTTSSADQSWEHALPSPLWAYQAPPSFVTAKGCYIDWAIFHNLPGPVPLPADRACRGNAVDLTFRPYGSMRTRMSELPTISLSGSNSTNSTQKYTIPNCKNMESCYNLYIMFSSNYNLFSCICGIDRR